MRRAKQILFRCQDQSALYRVVANVLSNLRIRRRVQNPEFRKTLLPKWGFHAQFLAGAERESALDELDRFLNADFTSHGQEQMKVVRHDHEFMQSELSLCAIFV